MREQKGPVGRLADTIAGTMRRRQQDREPRVLLYDGAGEPRVIQPGTDAHAELVATAQRLIDAGGGGQVETEPIPGEGPEGTEPSGDVA